MTEYMSGEKHQAMMAAKGPKQVEIPKSLLAGVAVIILMGLSFYGGVAYQKSHHPAVSIAASGTSTSGGFAGGRRFGGQRPTAGAVTAVSATSITVQDSRTGSSVTLSITSSTQITDNSQTVTASDIQTGDTVLVVASTTDKTQAARILVNPTFGGGSQSSPSGAPGSTTTN
jgi:hypothetical protein